MKHFDLALIGFGAATMSLAVRLAARYPGRIAIIEPRQLPSDDRTWCGWRLVDHPFVDQATQIWTRWAVSHGGREIIRGSDQTPYEMLRASAVQAQALDVIGTRQDWSLFAGSALQAAERHDSAWSLTLDSGETLTATRVMDSRPPALALDRPWVWQSFVGRELTGPGLAGESPVRLMDFVDDTTPLLTFVYELPIGPGHRLIELTRFAPQRPSLSELGGQLDRILADRGLAAHTVVREESSHLPMAPIPSYDQEGWMRVGTAGGSMRPATGYTFHDIQRWADVCAEALVAGQAPRAPSRRSLMDWLDGVFLESLWRHRPVGAAGEPFVRLFDRTPPESMARFLMSRPQLADIGHILRALPPTPMLKAAMRHSCRRNRGVRIDSPTG
ncbi:lycopene cyclase family protein [Spiribacter vilamensis]|uniref:Lycopene beta-cyclase n=1 Tax=Spiribacter vilamensis TaxID=531306 RepID=A0A4Q8CZ97_9GAMM|nr:lycopene cyclase family protein [Spiribacter vilamensis]RZU98294.1 lycopene beta-cyclase [Spiribacter vilamensis]TVO60814.1 hypothetical protein FPL09_01235 [Spiribacter vilamensis]